MAKRKTRTTTTHYRETDIAKTCAFWGLVISAIMFMFNGVIQFLLKVIKEISPGVSGALSSICGVLNLLASIALLVAIAIPAYRYVRYRTKGWRALYWVCLIVYLLGIVFGIIPSFF